MRTEEESGQRICLLQRRGEIRDSGKCARGKGDLDKGAQFRILKDRTDASALVAERSKTLEA